MILGPKYIEFLKNLEDPPAHWGGTGALRLTPDPRDVDIRSLPGMSRALAVGLPDAVDLSRFVTGPVLDQKAEGACVAFSTAHLGSIDDVIEDHPWPFIDAETMYHRAGGTGSNGVDSRLVLQQAVDTGMPIQGGGAVKVIQGYAFVPQQSDLFSQTIKAALAAGYPVVLALLLPSDFGAPQSGHGTRTSGYHQICLLGYTADGYFIFLNSWGPGFGRNGIASIYIPYILADNLQNDYAFSYTVAALLSPTPPPPPPTSLVVSSYAPNPVPSGGSLSIAGSGFGQDATAGWGGVPLAISTRTATALAATAPTVGASAASPVIVNSNGQTAQGPPLTVSAPAPPPPPNSVIIAGRVAGPIIPVLAVGQELAIETAGQKGTLAITQVNGGPPPPDRPTLLGLTPLTVPYQQPVTITGLRLGAAPGTVQWGATALMATAWSDTQITVTVPMGAPLGANPITVTTSAGASVTGLSLAVTDIPPPPPPSQDQIHATFKRHGNQIACWAWASSPDLQFVAGTMVLTLDSINRGSKALTTSGVPGVWVLQASSGASYTLNFTAADSTTAGLSGAVP